MKRSTLYSRVILVTGGFAVLLMSGCATVQENASLIDARETYSKAQSDASVNKFAPLELQDAQIALQETEESWEAGNDVAEVEHLAYMAKQKSLIAQEVASMKIADNEVEATNAELNKVLLASRTREAEASLGQAKMARQEAEQSLSQAGMARQEASTQRLAAEESLMQAQMKTAEAKMARAEAAASEARSMKLEAQISDLQAQKTERGLVLTLGDVLFDTGKSDLKSGAQSTIDKLVSFLKEYPTRKIQIEGFTDSVGSDEFNMELSIHRAEAVRNAVNDRGIELDRIMYRGYGEALPVATNDTAAGRQRNRRVEVVISDETGVIVERTY